MQPEEIKKQENILLQAMKNADVRTLEELLHDELIFIIPSGETVNKESDIKNIRDGKIKIEAISPKKQLIKIIDDIAIVSVIIELKGRFMGQAIDGDYSYLRTWKRFGGQLKIISGAGIKI